MLVRVASLIEETTVLGWFRLSRQGKGTSFLFLLCPSSVCLCWIYSTAAVFRLKLSPFGEYIPGILYNCTHTFRRQTSWNSSSIIEQSLFWASLKFLFLCEAGCVLHSLQHSLVLGIHQFSYCWKKPINNISRRREVTSMNWPKGFHSCKHRAKLFSPPICWGTWGT